MRGMVLPKCIVPGWLTGSADALAKLRKLRALTNLNLNLSSNGLWSGAQAPDRLLQPLSRKIKTVPLKCRIK